MFALALVAGFHAQGVTWGRLTRHLRWLAAEIVADQSRLDRNLIRLERQLLFVELVALLVILVFTSGLYLLYVWALRFKFAGITCRMSSVTRHTLHNVLV